jgi:drug/metabolite transporter (DMT)-like permease
MNGLYYGELIALATSLSWAICIFPFTVAVRRLGSNVLNHFRLLLALLLITLLAVILEPVSFGTLFTAPSPGNWLWLGVSGVIGFSLGDYFGFRMYAILGTRIGSLFTTLAPGASLLFGYLLLDERINLIGICGIAVTVGGVAWLTMSKKEKAKIPDLGHGKVEWGIIFGVLGALCQGIGLVLSKKGLQAGSPELGPVHATWIRLLAATVPLYLLSLIRGEIIKINLPILQNKNNGVLPAIAGTVFGPVLGVALSLYTVSMIEVSVAQTIFSLIPVFALPIGWMLNRERITLKAVFGALLAVSGVLLLIWRNEIIKYF